MRIFKVFNRHASELSTAPEEYRLLLNLEPNSIDEGDGSKIVTVKGTELLTCVNLPMHYTTTAIIETNLGIFSFGSKEGMLHYAKLIFNSSRTEVTYQNFQELGPTYNANEHLDIYTLEESELMSKMYIDVIKSEDFDDIQHYTFYIPLNGTPYLVNTDIIEKTLPPITLVSLTKGRLYSGLYSYSYRLLSKYGQYTRWANLGDSVPVPLYSGTAVQGPEYINELDNYQDAPITQSGLRVTIPTVDLTAEQESYFTHVELLRIYKYSAFQVPIFEIVTIIPFENNKITIADTDSTMAIETLTFAEFAVPLQYYKYKHKAVLNNRMFIVGIQDKVFPSVEFPDLRAYQFQASSYTTEYKVTSQVDDNIPEGTYQLTGNFIYKIDVGGTLYDIPTKSDIPRSLREGLSETFESDEYLHPSNETIGTYGASGRHIEIRYTDIAGGIVSYGGELGEYPKVTFNTNPSPKVIQHNSLYRLGVIFIDSKGNESKVQIIGDIATPRFKPDELFNTGIAGIGTLKGKLFQITLVLGTAYAGYKARLVYVPRTLADRRNLGFTYAMPVYIDALTDKLVTTPIDNTVTGGSLLFNTEHLVGNIELDNNTDFLHYHDTVPEENLIGNTRFIIPQTPVITTLYEKVELNTAEPDPSNSITYKIPNPETVVENLPNLFGIGENHPTHLSKCLIYGPVHESVPYTGLLLQRNINPYGGTLYSTCANSKFVPFSDVITLDQSGSATFESYGDTYMGLSVMQIDHKGRTDSNYTDLGKNASYIILPVESAVNVDFVGDKLRKVIYENSAKYLAPTGNVQYTHTINGDKRTTQLDLPNLYSMHSLFSTNILTAEYFIENNIADLSSKFSNMIRYSERKYLAEFKDNYRVFKPNNFNEIDTEWGRVTNIKVFRQKLLVFQERRVSVVLVNETSQVIDNNDAIITLGSGDVLGIPGGRLSQPIAEDVGCGFKSNIIKSKSSIYWLDARNRHIYRYMGNNPPQAITLVNNVQDLFSRIIKIDTEFIGTYYGSTGQVYMTIINKTGGVIDTGVKFVNVGQSSGGVIFTGNTDNIYAWYGLEFMLYNNGITYPVKVTSLGGSSITLKDFSLSQQLQNVPYVYLYGIAKTLKSFTIVYDEVLNAFTHVLSVVPSFYTNINREIFMLTYEHDTAVHGTAIGNEKALIYKLSDTKRSIFFGRLVPGIIDYIHLNSTEAVFDNLKFITEMFHRINPKDVDWTHIMNRTLSAIQLMTSHRSTNMLPIVPQREEYTDFIEAETGEVHPDPTSITANSQYEPFRTVEDIVTTNLHNAQRIGDIWSTPIPHIISYIQSNVPKEDAEGTELMDNVRGLYATIRLHYHPTSADYIFKLISIL